MFRMVVIGWSMYARVDFSAMDRYGVESIHEMSLLGGKWIAIAEMIY